jgi:hypothetical protein
MGYFRLTLRPKKAALPKYFLQIRQRVARRWWLTGEDKPRTRAALVAHHAPPLGLGALPHTRDANAQAFCASAQKMFNNNMVLHITPHIGRIVTKSD